jgi:hypothetical protein
MSWRFAHHGHGISGCRMGIRTLKIAPDFPRSGAGQCDCGEQRERGLRASKRT